MYVCLCHGIRENDIRRAVEGGAQTLADLMARTGCGTGCGGCLEYVAQLLPQPTPLPQWTGTRLQAA